MPMHPRPIAETSSPLLPSARFFIIVSPLHDPATECCWKPTARAGVAGFGSTCEAGGATVGGPAAGLGGAIEAGAGAAGLGGGTNEFGAAAATGFGAGGRAGVAGTAAATSFLAGPLAIGLPAGDVAAFAFLAGALAIAFLAVGLRAGDLAGLAFLAGFLAITFWAVGLRAGDLAALALLAGALARPRFAAVLSAGFLAADFFVVLVAAATFIFPVTAFFVFFAMTVLPIVAADCCGAAMSESRGGVYDRRQLPVAVPTAARISWSGQK